MESGRSLAECIEWSRVGSRKLIKGLSRRTPPDSASTDGDVRRENSNEFVVKYDIKRLSSWFNSWQAWQQRLLVCTVMNCSTKQQLMMLATSLEPILHMDFCSILDPPLQSLHLDGVALFQNRRPITHRYMLPEIIPKVDSEAYLDSLPSTFLSKKTTMLCKKPVQNLSSVSLGKNLSQGNTPIQTISAPSLTASSYFLFALKEPLMNNPLRSASRPRGVAKTPIKKPPKIRKKEAILPALPLTHPSDHLPTPVIAREASFDQMLGLRRQRFSSVPEFQCTVELMKKSGRKLVSEKKRETLFRRKTIGSYHVQTQSWQQKAEQFKEQLAQVTSWMIEWEEMHKSYLLAELVKLCDKDLLGYFVQCLHQKLSDTMDISSLPDSALLQVFMHLDPKDLCTASQVCKHWNACSNVAILWKKHAYLLGVSEGVGNIAEVMETVIEHYRHALQHVREEDKPVVDWKRAYRDLLKLVTQMKHLVLKNADEAGKCELEDRLRSAARSRSARNRLSLMEMLEILRVKYTKLSATTHELYMMAPESSSAARRRLRAERRAALEAEADQDKDQSSRLIRTKHLIPVLSPLGAWTPTRNLEFAQQLMMSIREVDPTYGQFLQQFNLEEGITVPQVDPNEDGRILRLDVAQELRPRAPHLPDPNAIACLILAGGLLSSTAPRLGRIVEIPRLRRMERVDSVVMCMQCDSRRIVVGTFDRIINVYDMRSGRPVATLTGHKGSVQCLQFDDYKIISGSWDTTCIVWDVVHFKMVRQVHGHTECVSCLQFDEDVLVTGSHDGSMRIWSTSSWDILTIISSAHQGGMICLKMNDRIIASGGVDMTVKVWSFSSHQCMKVIHHDSPVISFGLSHLLLVSCCIDGSIIFWNLDSYQPMMKMHTSNGAYMRELAQFNTKFFGAGSDGMLYELDISTGTCLRTLKGHSLIITAVSFMDNKLVSTSADKTIVTWHLQTLSGCHGKGEEGGEEGGGEMEGEHEEGEGTGSETSSEVKARECRYKARQFFNKFPLHHLIEDADRCSFVYDSLDPAPVFHGRH